MQHQAIAFPFAAPPGPGAVAEVAPGVLWLRFALPFALDHVNVYLVADDGGWAVLDTGIDDAPTRAAWDAVLAGPLRGERLTRLIVTHYHPDHLGLAMWLIERFGLPLHMTRTDYLMAQYVRRNPDALDRADALAFYGRHGLSEAAAQSVLGRGSDYVRMTTGLPPHFHRLRAGQALRLGGRTFQVMTGGGHAPEQAMLLCAEERLFFPADQVLARISPNVSVWSTEPDADPLGDYVASLRALAGAVPDESLVLAAHNLPFVGLQRRIGELLEHHAGRCRAVLEAAGAPVTTAGLLPVLFRRSLDPHQTGFAFGEALAHVNYLLAQGELASRAGADGVLRVQRADVAAPHEGGSP